MSKVVIITGIRSSFGTSIAKALISANHKVYGTTSTESPLPIEDPKNFVLCQFDHSNKIEIEKFLKDIYEKEGRIDILINNATIGIIGPAEEMEINDVESMIQINFFNMVQITKAAIMFMRKKKSGKIINVSSLGGQLGLPFRAAFSASKFAIEGFSEALRMEIKQYGIHVTLLEPGSFKINYNTNRKVALVSVYSQYKANFDQTLSKIDLDRKNNSEKAKKELTRIIQKIVMSKKPKFRYQIGPWQQKLYPVIKALTPFPIYEKIIMKYYGISLNPVINRVPNTQSFEEDTEENSSENINSIFTK